MKTAVLPGSFDPVTVGHLDLVRRAAAIFDRVIVCVMVNGEKRPMFTPEQRLAMLRASLVDIPSAQAALWNGLLVDFVRHNNALALVKGARCATDFEWEYQLAQINRSLCPGLDTIILPALPDHLHISSTMVRDMIRYCQPLDPYVPAGAAAILESVLAGKEV